MSKIVKKILKDARVSSVSDERRDGHGFWIYLNGFCLDSSKTHDEGSCRHSIHKNSPTAAFKRLTDAIACDCSRCRE